MQLPKCGRCSKKNIACCYPNGATSVSEMSLPELDFSWLDDMMQDSTMVPWSGGLSSLNRHGLPLNSELAFIEDSSVPIEGSVTTTLARLETDNAVHQFKTYPDKWLKEGKAPFIHAALYASNMPKALQDAYCACAIYATKTENNEHIVFSIIEAKATELLRSYNPSWTSLDLLAAIQSLLIFQIIRLFDGDIRQRALAEQAEATLGTWTEALCDMTVAERNITAITAPSWISWTFAESVRRTVIMSFFLRGIYSLIKQSFCTVAARVTSYSFTGQQGLWSAQSAFQWEKARQSLPQHWISKMDFEDVLQNAKGHELDDFGIMMMTTYRGQDLVDDWLVSTKSVRSLVDDPDMFKSLDAVINSGVSSRQ